VGNLLEEFGFRAEIKKDSVFARVEGQPEDYMRERLKILGYLIIHTRQLDMVMGNHASVNHYRSKLLGEIREMLTKPGETCSPDAQDEKPTSSDAPGLSAESGRS
jgi:pyruvate,water dikinase